MNDLIYLARSRAALIWLVLIIATSASWWLGVHHIGGLENTEGAVGAVVILIAMIKVRLVAINFMEIRHAPTPLRVLVELYCAVVLIALVTILLVT